MQNNVDVHADMKHTKGFVVPEHMRTNDQRMLRVLLNILLLWVIVTFLVHIGYRLAITTPVTHMFGNFDLFIQFVTGSTLPLLGFIVSLVMVGLGYRGMRNPYKIGPFFAIIFVDAMLIGWDLASLIFMGVIDILYIVYGGLIILTAYYAWQVKKTTYPDDWFEQKEAAKELKREAKRIQKEHAKDEKLHRREERKAKHSA